MSSVTSDLPQREAVISDKSKSLQQPVFITVTTDPEEDEYLKKDFRSHSDVEDGSKSERLYVGRNSSPDLRKYQHRRLPHSALSKQRKSEIIEAKYREDLDSELEHFPPDLMTRSNSLDYSTVKSSTPTQQRIGKKITDRFFRSFAAFDKRSQSLHSSTDSLDQYEREDSNAKSRKSSTLPSAFRSKLHFHAFDERLLNVSNETMNNLLVINSQVVSGLLLFCPLFCWS